MANGEVDGDLTKLFGRVKPASMNKIPLMVSMLYAFCSLTYAGPERYSGKEIKQVASPPPCPNWTGFYVGAFGGYKFGSTGVDLSLGEDWNFRPEDRNVVEAHAPDNLDASGAEAGGLIGYNHQFTNNWVVGLEAAGGYLWLRQMKAGFFTLRRRGTSISRRLSKHIIWLRLGHGLAMPLASGCLM